MISSLNNPKIKHLEELSVKARTRNKEGLFVAEGIRIFLECPDEYLKEIYVELNMFNKLEESFKETPSSLWGRAYSKIVKAKENGVFAETITQEVLKKASDTESPQGLIFISKKPHYELKDMLKGENRHFLMLEDIQDPGNLGTMLRTAEGASMSGVIMSKGTVDIFNPKVVRSTMGSLYRVPFLYTDDIMTLMSELQSEGICIYAAYLDASVDYKDIKPCKDNAVLIGNEGNGLRQEVAMKADNRVRIPMGGKLESLNAAVAAGILMYEYGGR